jgi:hypothetical protein
MNRPLLSDGEIAALLTWLAMERGGFDVAEAAALVGWARRTRRASQVLQRVLSGDRVDIGPDILPPVRQRHLLTLVETVCPSGAA